MKKVYILCLFCCCFLIATAENDSIPALPISVNTVATFSVGQPMAGLSFVLDDRKAMFQAGIYAGYDGKLHSQFKLGATIRHDFDPVNSKFTVYPLWADVQIDLRDASRSEIVLASSLMWSKSVPLRDGNYLGFSAGFDIYVDPYREAEWPVKNGELTWRPNLSLEYCFGSRWYPGVQYRKKKFRTDRWMQVNGFDLIALGLGVMDGVARGGLEFQSADPVGFQEFLGVGDYGWGGIKEWERKYRGRRYRDEEGNINPIKSQLFGNFGVDAKHTLTDISKWSGRFMGTAIGISICLETLKTRKEIAGLGKLDRKTHNRYVAKTVCQLVFRYVLIYGVSSFTERQVYNLRYR